MLKKIIVAFLLICSVVMSLCACKGAFKEHALSYKIIRENEKVYVDVGMFSRVDHRDYIDVYGYKLFFVNPNNGAKSASVSFNTFDEMYEDMKFGYFNESELENIGKFAVPNDQYLIEIFDYEKLHVPVFPDSYTVLNGIFWRGTGYKVNAKSSTGVKAACYFGTEGEFHSNIDRYSNMERYSDVISKEINPENGCITYIFDPKSDKNRAMFYTLQQGDITKYVYEEYISYKLPARVQVLALKDDIYYCYEFTNITEPITEQQIRSLGVEKFVPQRNYTVVIICALAVAAISVSVAIIVIKKRRYAF